MHSRYDAKTEFVEACIHSKIIRLYIAVNLKSECDWISITT